MRFALAILFVALVAAPVYFQDGAHKATKVSKPDFSGKWILDPNKSEFMKGMPGTRISGAVARKAGIKRESVSFPIVFIEHHDPEIRVTEKIAVDGRILTEEVYYSDGRGESNTDSNGERVDSKTKWDGKTLLTQVFKESEQGKKSDKIIARITLQLSKDGMTLTIISTPLDPEGGPGADQKIFFGVMVSKKVFHRSKD